MTENKRYIEINNKYIKDTKTLLKYDSNEVIDLLNEQNVIIKEQKKHEEKIFNYFFKWFERERNIDYETFREMWFNIKYGDIND